MCSTISIRLDAVDALAAELAALATDLGDEEGRCRSSAASLSAAFDGCEGWTTGATATAWASLAAVVAARTAAVAATLTGATAAYRAADASLAGGIGPQGRGTVGPR